MNSIESAGPGFATQKNAAPRNVFFNDGRDAQYLEGGRIISGADAADPLNTGDVRVLRAGNLMGKISSNGKFGSSIIGLTGEAIDGAETELTVSAATATELIRRQGTTGTFKITGPPVASGVVRTLTATYSAVGATTITLTALGVSAVWTLTAPNGTDGGAYRLKVTTPDGVSAITSNLAFDANSATVDAALEALSNVGASGVTAVYNPGTLTLTFASALGDVRLEALNDTTNDGGVFEGGWTLAHTTVGVSGEFVAGSLIQPTDGSETILTLTNDAWGLRVTDDSQSEVDVEGNRLLKSGSIDTSQIVNFPSDSSLKSHIKTSLNAVGHFTFSDSV